MAKGAKKEFTDLGLKNEPPAATGKRTYVWDTKVEGLGVRITDKGAKTFLITPRIKGKLWWKTLGSYPALPLKDARIQAGLLLARIRAGADPRAEEAEEKAPEALAASEIFTVAKAIEDYERKHISRLKPRSQLEARRPLEKILITRWYNSKLLDITKAELRGVLANMADEGAPVAANRSLAGLSAFFNWCVAEDRLDVNPCTGIRPPGGDEVSRDRILNDMEIKFLWPLMTEADYPYGPLAQMLLITAQRRDEVATMRWDEISDLDGGNPVWTIPAVKNKGGRLHEVPLSPKAARLLKSLPRLMFTDENGKSALSPFVFTTYGDTPFSGFSGGKERLDEIIAKELKRLAKEGKPTSPLPRWTLHDLRRTAASNMARADIPPHIVSRVLNHSPGKAEGVTAVYNRHGYLREKRHALETWASILGALVLQEGLCP